MNHSGKIKLTKINYINEKSIDDLLRPKVVNAKKLNERQKRMMESYKLFKLKYVNKRFS